jgi:hypothetical protein
MKKLIDRFLDWLKIKPKTKPQEVAAWPFPSEETPKAKPAVKKATTRVRKTRDLPSRATVAKKAVSKKAK